MAMSDTNISAMTPVFDVGNVLLRWDVKALYRTLLPTEAEIDAFLIETGLFDMHWRFDAGKPFAEGIAELTAAHPAHADLLQAYDARWMETITGPIDGSVDLLARLRDRGNVYAITNFPSEKWRDARTAYPFLTGFQDVVVSGDEKMVKPDPAIYRLLLDRNRLDAARCLFIDDRAENVTAARAVGMDAVQFTGPETLQTALTARGML